MGLFDRLMPGRAQTHAAQAEVAALRRQVESLQEDAGGMWAATYDPDANLPASGGGSAYYRRLSASRRDLDSMTQERMLAVAFFLYESNPLAKRILEMTRDFILGDGAALESAADDPSDKDAQQSVLDRFWTDPYNRLDLKLFDKVLELGLYGELCLPVAVNPKDGHVRLGYLDPADIVAVITDPQNAEIAQAVATRVPGSATERRYYRVIHVDENPASVAFGRMVGVEQSRDGLPLETIVDPEAGAYGRGVEMAGACFLFRVNKVSNARRGRSDLLALADWIDALDQVLFGEVDRALLLKNFVWDVTIQGADDTAIKQYLKNNTAPKPGSVRAHNEKVQWQAVTPDLKVVDAQIGVDILLSYAATGAGLPKTWLNGLMDANRATASEMSEPAFKRLAARQRYVRYLLELVGTFVLDQAELAGRLPRRANEPGTVRPVAWALRATLPELRQRDITSAATAMSSTVSALVAALTENLLDVETAQDVLALLIGQFGIDVDLQAMRQRLADARAEQDAQQADTAPYARAAALAAQLQDGADQPAALEGPLPLSAPREAVSSTGALREFNPYHDENGRFAQSQTGATGGSGSGSNGGVHTSDVAGSAGDASASDSGADYAELTRKPQIRAVAKHYEDWSMKDVTDEEAKYLVGYKQFEYKRVNASLRNGFVFNEAKMMDQVLDRAPSLPQNLKLFRGMPAAEIPKSLKAGDLIQDKGYVSTSLDRKTAREFGGVSVEIRAHKGQAGAWMDPFGSAEYEVLLPRGSVFRVVSRDRGSLVLEYAGYDRPKGK